MSILEHKDTLKNIRSNILKISHNKKAGHIASSFSILEILYVLYSNFDSLNDSLVLSKGHASLGLYGILEHFGYISSGDLETFCSYDSKLGGHPDRNKVNGVIASTGSLGHGLPIAVGLALAKKIKNEKGRIYCIIGDGESNEGTIWESAILATHLKLSNLTCIVDYNDSQIRAVSTNKILEKFKSFDWNVENIEDGHDINEIQRRIFMTHEKYPTCIIANTVKGFGIKEIEEDMFSWHHRPPTDVELHKFLQELKV